MSADYFLLGVLATALIVLGINIVLVLVLFRLRAELAVSVSWTDMIAKGLATQSRTLSRLINAASLDGKPTGDGGGDAQSGTTVTG